ncbi:hypothetical protein AX774_g2778 [Zancudomyces culisetae]|uniref:Uncharacterized protein n=1 Tax=Zancudomyces culisetae TaxID=1213189 RepID=A0A1R1PS31_ZANCU|nr:hypothetical protein AX774_g2778 [Zancudomyces culisetae]|eukprot:OMH83702.1 hypothetical protein AX774_g2778 [Zancudomyces culisetae]
MSRLNIFKFQKEERDSVLIPTVRCTNCSVEIKLSDLGSHSCSSSIKTVQSKEELKGEQVGNRISPTYKKVLAIDDEVDEENEIQSWKYRSIFRERDPEKEFVNNKEIEESFSHMMASGVTANPKNVIYNQYQHKPEAFTSKLDSVLEKGDGSEYLSEEMVEKYGIKPISPTNAKDNTHIESMIGPGHRMSEYSCINSDDTVFDYAFKSKYEMRERDRSVEDVSRIGSGDKSPHGLRTFAELKNNTYDPIVITDKVPRSREIKNFDAHELIEYGLINEAPEDDVVPHDVVSHDEYKEYSYEKSINEPPLQYTPQYSTNLSSNQNHSDFLTRTALQGKTIISKSRELKKSDDISLASKDIEYQESVISNTYSSTLRIDDPPAKNNTPRMAKDASLNNSNAQKFLVSRLIQPTQSKVYKPDLSPNNTASITTTATNSKTAKKIGRKDMISSPFGLPDGVKVASPTRDLKGKKTNLFQTKTSPRNLGDSNNAHKKTLIQVKSGENVRNMYSVSPKKSSENIHGRTTYLTSNSKTLKPTLHMIEPIPHDIIQAKGLSKSHERFDSFNHDRTAHKDNSGFKPQIKPSSSHSLDRKYVKANFTPVKTSNLNQSSNGSAFEDSQMDDRSERHYRLKITTPASTPSLPSLQKSVSDPRTPSAIKDRGQGIIDRLDIVLSELAAEIDSLNSKSSSFCQV